MRQPLLIAPSVPLSTLVYGEVHHAEVEASGGVDCLAEAILAALGPVLIRAWPSGVSIDLDIHPYPGLGDLRQEQLASHGDQVADDEPAYPGRTEAGGKTGETPGLALCARAQK